MSAGATAGAMPCPVSGMVSATQTDEDWREIHVVFCGQAQIVWLRCLRPGFRHCFVVFGNGRLWLTLDPLSCWTDVRIQPIGGGFDLPAWYRAQGMITIPVTLVRHQPSTSAPWGPFTCVEAVKRVVGLRDRRVLTPYQLYRRLGDCERQSEPKMRAGHRPPLTPRQAAARS